MLCDGNSKVGGLILGIYWCIGLSKRPDSSLLPQNYTFQVIFFVISIIIGSVIQEIFSMLVVCYGILEEIFQFYSFD